MTFVRLAPPLHRHRLLLTVMLVVWLTAGYFFQGGGWNQNAHFGTTTVLVERGSIYLDDYRSYTGDLSHSGGRVVSAKAIATALVAVPSYVVARTVTLPVDNRQDRVTLTAYLTAWWTAGTALALLAGVIFTIARRRLPADDAAWLALALTLATPLFPNSTMLTSHPLAALAMACCYALLDAPHLAQRAPSRRELALAGVAAGAGMAFEYLMAVVAAVLGLYALVLLRGCRRRVVWLAAGALPPLLIPIVHHTVAYGAPWETGYGHLVHPGFARDASVGFMGFAGFSLSRLYELTFGASRGFFYLSPMLVGVVPGVLRLLRQPHTRLQGLVNGAAAWGMLLLMACLVYWHSGAAVGSRYALVFIVFTCVPLASLVPEYRGWIWTGALVGLAIMLMGTSVTATPPTPRGPPFASVIGWWWERFSVGNLASWQQAISMEPGPPGPGVPAIPYAFNLGQLLGLPGRASLIPLGLGLLAAAWWVRRSARLTTGS